MPKKTVLLAMPVKAKTKKTDNPKNKKRSEKTGRSSSIVNERKGSKRKSSVSGKTIITALHELRVEYEQADLGYRQTLYRIIGSVADHGIILSKDEKLWESFRSADNWDGKKPKKQADATRFALKLVFPADQASLYWRAIKHLVAKGYGGDRLAEKISRGGGIKKLADKAAMRKAQNKTDDDEAPPRPKSAKPLSQYSNDIRRSDVRGSLMVPFRFAPEDIKRFPKADGSRITVKGVFNLHTKEVDVERWELI